MSLADFQRAMADLVASPELCLKTLAQPAQLGVDYDLTDLELRRLLYCVRHRGMNVCWGLHRANRLGPVHAVLPLTCVALGSHLGGELEKFWNEALPKDLQFRSEGERFAAFLMRRVREGSLDLSVIESLVQFELAVSDLRFQPLRPITEALAHAESVSESNLVLHPLIRLLRFSHDPEPVLEALTHDRPVPGDLLQGTFYVVVDGKQEDVAIRVVDKRLGRILECFKFGLPNTLGESETAILLKAGLIARWAETPIPQSRPFPDHFGLSSSKTE